METPRTSSAVHTVPPGTKLDLLNRQDKAARVTLACKATGLSLTVTLAPGMTFLATTGKADVVVTIDHDSNHPSAGLRLAIAKDEPGGDS